MVEIYMKDQAQKLDMILGLIVCVNMVLKKKIDYFEIVEKVSAQKRARTYEQVNHILKLDMAKLKF